ncbi:hypothetical protein I862_02015 [endosymbiont of Acanthamoeba sp. UWC8]|nr:hypothetical protein I862_02015 [endosymbiont of Acanthamoeba sp. UWC8]
MVIGETVEVALNRCHQFADAGADFIVVHEKGGSASKIYEFLKNGIQNYLLF